MVLEANIKLVFDELKCLEFNSIDEPEAQGGDNQISVDEEEGEIVRLELGCTTGLTCEDHISGAVSRGKCTSAGVQEVYVNLGWNSFC